MTTEIIVTLIVVPITVALIAVAGPLWLDIRKARREAAAAAVEAERERDATRAQAAAAAERLHREALAAKDQEIAYWREMALSCLLPRGERLPSGPPARR